MCGMHRNSRLAPTHNYVARIEIFITKRIKATLVSFTPVLGVVIMCFGAANYPKMKMFADKYQKCEHSHKT